MQLIGIRRHPGVPLPGIPPMLATHDRSQLQILQPERRRICDRSSLE